MGNARRSNGFKYLSKKNCVRKRDEGRRLLLAKFEQKKKKLSLLDRKTFFKLDRYSWKSRYALKRISILSDSNLSFLKNIRIIFKFLLLITRLFFYFCHKLYLRFYYFS